MLSTLPKLLDKSFVIGFFFPALLAVLLVGWAFPSIAMLDPLRSLAASDKKLSDLTYIVLFVATVAILLLTTNHLQYRCLRVTYRQYPGWRRSAGGSEPVLNVLRQSGTH